MNARIITMNVQGQNVRRKKKKSIYKTLRRNIIPLLKLITIFTVMITIVFGIIVNHITKQVSEETNRILNAPSEITSEPFDYSVYFTDDIEETTPVNDIQKVEEVVTPVNVVKTVEQKPEERKITTVSRGTSREEKIYENIPLSAELQHYAFNLCEENGVPFDLFMGLIKKESDFDPKAVSKDGHDFGLCQVRDVNFPDLTKALGIKDFMDPKNNIRASIYILAPYIKKYGNESMHLALMCYNQGEKGARDSWKINIYSTKYSWAVINNAKAFSAKKGN